MKRVLIITYYWPPSGGAGVQRWLRFVRHLRHFGWEPVIYTPKDPSYVVYDENLQKEVPDDVEVIRYPIMEPNNLIKKLSFLLKKNKEQLYENQQQKGSGKTLLQKALWYVRGNYFIPDARFLWVRPSFKYLSRILPQKNIDVVVSTGPPHSLHLIAAKLKMKHNIPWVADFRDPWTSMDYLQEMDLSAKARRKHEKLERQVVTSADRVIVVGSTMWNEFRKVHGVSSTIIHNGFDTMPALEKVQLDRKFTICHIGSFLKNRNCDDLWQVLSSMVGNDADFRSDLQIRLIGRLAPNVQESLNKYGLLEYTDQQGYVPFAETQEYLYASQVLLLAIDRIENAEFVLTGKIFEYLKSQRPILLIGPSHGDAAAIIDRTKAGYCADFDDVVTIKAHIMEMYGRFKRGENQVESVGVKKFSGPELTKKLVTVLNELV